MHARYTYRKHSITHLFCARLLQLAIYHRATISCVVFCDVHHPSWPRPHRLTDWPPFCFCLTNLYSCAGQLKESNGQYGNTSIEQLEIHTGSQHQTNSIIHLGVMDKVNAHMSRHLESKTGTVCFNISIRAATTTHNFLAFCFRFLGSNTNRLLHCNTVRTF